MKVYRKLTIWALLALLITAMAIPVSAAKPQKTDCGILSIATGSNDMQNYMAVCVAEEDGTYIYSGNHPIQQQIAMYSTYTNSLQLNNIYDLEEDKDYDAVQGVYRFALGDVVQSGTEADVFPEMASVSSNDTVYFVHLDMDDSDVFVMEKSTVASVRGGVLTTKDSLEEDSENGDFSVIFNDSGDVVGFCKSGVASAPASGNSGGSYILWIIAAAAVAGAAILLVWKKKGAKDSVEVDDQVKWENDSTTLDSDTQMGFEFDAVPSSGLAIKCHGGYLNGRSYPIPPEGITIGREPDNSIRYPAQTPGISRHHAKLFWQNGQLVLLDLGSSNGTYLNQTGRISPMRPVPLNPGDIFYLGEKLNAFEISYK